MGRLSWLIPYRRLTIDTSLSPRELGDVLAPNITQGDDTFFPRTRDVTTPYVGELRDKSFQIHRFIRHKNSFLPIITGTIEPREGGARVRITMRPYLFTIIFMAIWFSSAFLGSLVSLNAAFAQGFTLPHLMPLTMIGFGVALVSFSFGIEARRSESWLREIIPPLEESGLIGPYR